MARPAKGGSSGAEAEGDEAEGEEAQRPKRTTWKFPPRIPSGRGVCHAHVSSEEQLSLRELAHTTSPEFPVDKMAGCRGSQGGFPSHSVCNSHKLALCHHPPMASKSMGRRRLRKPCCRAGFGHSPAPSVSVTWRHLCCMLLLASFLTKLLLHSLQWPRLPHHLFCQQLFSSSSSASVLRASGALLLPAHQGLCHPVLPCPEACFTGKRCTCKTAFPLSNSQLLLPHHTLLPAWWKTSFCSVLHLTNSAPLSHCGVWHGCCAPAGW